MRSRPVRYTETAANDVERAREAVLELSQSTRTADGYIARLYDRMGRIGDVPLGGRPRDDLAEGLRLVYFENRPSLPTGSRTGKCS